MSGMDGLLRNLQILADEAPDVLEQAVKAVALDIQGRATQKAPVETGHLRESAFTEIVEAGPGGVTATVGFNATTKDGKFSYALIQHEETEWNHPLGGEAKYLEKAVIEVEGDFTDRIAEGVENLVRRLRS